MDPDRWRRIEYLYHEALAREDGERSSFLAQVCGSDEELRREVESLVKSKRRCTYLKDQKVKAELTRISRELKRLKIQMAAPEERKIRLNAELGR